MASNKAVASTALLLSLNLLFSAMVSSQEPVASTTCSIDTLRLDVCANLLKKGGSLVIGSTQTTPCCSLIGGLVDLEAALCLCTAIRANVLGINLNIPLSLTVLLNACGRNLPSGFECS